MADTMKFTTFTESDCEQYTADYNHDVKLDNDSKGKGVNPEDYKFAFNPTKLSPITQVDVKGLPYEDKKRFLKFCFKCECLNNASIVSNLVIIAQGKLIDEELYESDEIFFVDDIEFLDLCNDLREEIEFFNTKIVTYFLASLKSLSSLLDDNAVHIPNLYFTSLASYTMQNISSAMQKVSIDYDSLPYVYAADTIVDKVCLKKNIINDFMDSLLKDIDL